MNGREQMEKALAEIEAELPDEIDERVAMDALRAAYAKGYMAALTADGEPS